MTTIFQAWDLNRLLDFVNETSPNDSIEKFEAQRDFLINEYGFVQEIFEANGYTNDKRRKCMVNSKGHSVTEYDFRLHGHEFKKLLWRIETINGKTRHDIDFHRAISIFG